MEQGKGDPVDLNDEIQSIRAMAHTTANTAQRLELKTHALCQLLLDKGLITSDEHKRLTLWGTDSTR